jgi:hypothetical protein
MSTTPVVTPIVTQLHPISVYLKAHERFVLAAIAGLVLWVGVGHIEGIIARHDDANLKQAQIVAAAQADTTAKVAAQVAEQAAQYQTLATKVQAQNDALMQANVALSTALAKQQKTDATLPPSDLVARWNTLVPQASAAVTPSGVGLPVQGAVSTVQALEQIPVLSAQLGNTRTQLESAQSLVTAEGQQIATLNTEVGSLRLQQGDDAKVCTAQIAVVRAAAAKSKRRWFLVGFVAGWVSRQAVKTYTGL